MFGRSLDFVEEGSETECYSIIPMKPSENVQSISLGAQSGKQGLRTANSGAAADQLSNSSRCMAVWKYFLADGSIDFG